MSQYTHALIIGGSMAGLLTARVLADHFDKVTIIERDTYPTQQGPRKGVPQARHTHILLVGGQRILDQLFPNFGNEVEAAGALRVNWGQESCTIVLGGIFPQFDSDLITYTCTRDMLEWHVRRRLHDYTNIEIVEAHDVIALQTNDDKTVVTGLHIRPRAGINGGPTNLSADLIIDASGRHTKTPQWLTELGYGEVETAVIDSKLGYATRIFRRTDDNPFPWKAAVVGTTTTNFRSAVLYPVEGNRWLVTLAGLADEQPTGDEADFLRFCQLLDDPAIYEAIKDAPACSPIYRYLQTQNIRRYYEKMSYWPQNYLVLGDAACAFNPAYGQGMTASAMAAVTLHDTLTTHGITDLNGFSQKFQKKLAKVIRTPWELAVGRDSQYGQEVPDTFITRFLHKYVERLTALSIKDKKVALMFSEVLHLTKQPTQLFHPYILWSMVRHT